MTRREYRKKMLEQKVIATVMLLLAAFIFWFCAHGVVPEDKDSGPAIMMVLLGVYMLFTKECWIY